MCALWLALVVDCLSGKQHGYDIVEGPMADDTIRDYICYMIERVARRIKQPNQYVVNTIGEKEWKRLISLANVLHCENPLKIEEEWICEYGMITGEFDVTGVDPGLVTAIPTATQMAKVYMRLILDTMSGDEDYVEGMIRVYNDPICQVIDNYNCSAYYEPSYVIARAYYEGGF